MIELDEDREEVTILLKISPPSSQYTNSSITVRSLLLAIAKIQKCFDEKALYSVHKVYCQHGKEGPDSSASIFYS